VHAVGGLRDTVLDTGAQGEGTGIRFDAPTATSLLAALERAMKLFRDRAALARVRGAAMARDSSWTASAQQYVQLYRSLRT
jgi:starch synthase